MIVSLGSEHIMDDDKRFSSIQSLVRQVIKDYSSWKTTSIPWFRGEPRDIKTPLLPRLFRVENGRKHEELKLLHHFRMKAPSLGLPYIPPRDYVDQWLFLAQHVGLPTRLLDWTGGLLIALHFALYTYQPGAVVWMLDPDELNRKTYGSFKDGDYALTWFSQKNRPLVGNDLIRIQKLVKTKGEYPIEKEIYDNIGYMNINKAWTQQAFGTPYPFALHPTNIHPRMSSQISRFTIHGDKETAMSDMNLNDRILRKYVITDRAIPKLKTELRMMGISHSSLFPELDGLSDELSEIY
jgi:hypothetical protein